MTIGVQEEAGGFAAVDPLLNAREGADTLGVSISTFWRWAGNGQLPQPVKLGALSRWPRSELLAFIERAKQARHKKDRKEKKER